MEKPTNGDRRVPAIHSGELIYEYDYTYIYLIPRCSKYLFF